MVSVELKVAGDINYHFQQEAAEFQILKASQGAIIGFMNKRIMVTGAILQLTADPKGLVGKMHTHAVVHARLITD